MSARSFGHDGMAEGWVAGAALVCDKMLKSRRGCLEKLRPRESLEPRDFLKANPRTKPEGFPSENPRHSGSPEGEVF